MRVRSLAPLIGLDLVMLWLCHRPAAAALIRHLAWEFLYAAGAAIKGKKDKRKINYPDRGTK